jgi:broad specificity phosphatase PhoE
LVALVGFVRFISHPQVRIDPAVPVPQWGLSDLGRLRAFDMTRQPWVESISAIVCSAELKATETAQILASVTGCSVVVRKALGENDRSATGFVEPHEFELLANAFFAAPGVSVRGWETALDAQRRIVMATADLIDDARDGGDVAIVGHGGVGTLLLCSLLDVPIDRSYDQPGQGHYWTLDAGLNVVVHRWLPIDMYTF